MTAFVLNTALGLSRNPFPPTPDAASYFFTPQLQEHFAELVHCIEARKGFLLLTGEVGLGKSTLVRRLLDTLSPQRVRSALVFNTFLQGEALLAAILRDFGLAPSPSLDEGLANLNAFLMEQRRVGVTCLLVIDDAQNLKPESLELVRLLCNLETGQEKLLQILLAGQPELEVLLDTPGMRQLKSRLIKHTRLTGLQREELARYFDFRVNAAGGAGRIKLQPAAARLLYAATEGNLRRIHLVLDRCLYGLAALSRQNVDVELMKAALRDVSLVPGSGAGGGRYRAAIVGAGAALALIGLVLAAQYVDWLGPPYANATVTPERPNPSSSSPALQAPSTVAPVPTPPPVAGASSDGAASGDLETAPAPVASAPAPASAPTSAATTSAATTSAATTAAPSPVPLAVSAAFTEESCLRQLGEPRPGRTRFSQRLPALLLTRARQWHGSCVFERDGKPWLMWYGQPLVAQSNPVTVTPQARRLQDLLVRQGAMAVKEVDGLYGPLTASALARFQTALGLDISVVPDELTTFLLEKLDAPAGTRHE